MPVRFCYEKLPVSAEFVSSSRGSAQDAFFKTSVLEMCVMSGKHWLLSLGGGKKRKQNNPSAFQTALSQ